MKNDATSRIAATDIAQPMQDRKQHDGDKHICQHNTAPHLQDKQSSRDQIHTPTTFNNHGCAKQTAADAESLTTTT